MGNFTLRFGALKNISKTLSFLLVLFLGIVAQESGLPDLRIPGITQYDVASNDFSKTNYVGRYALREDVGTMGRIGLGDARLGPDAYYKFFTTTVKLEEAAAPFTVPDMLYPIKKGTGPDSYGVRFIAIPEPKFDDNGNPLNNPASELNKYMRKFFYNDENADKYLYVFLPHSASNEVYYNNFSEMASRKVETSTHHVSAYSSPSGDQGKNSRRQMLDRGSINNVFAVSVKGVPQEALNTNLGIWDKLYYQNPEGYQFSDDYKMDWVTAINPEETFAFATGWVDHNWRRRDFNKEVTQKAIEAGRPKSAPLDKPYYRLLQEHRMLGIYCFEGVVTMLNVGLNIPLTLEYFQRIWGRVRGALMFAMTNERYKQIQRNEMQRRDRNGNPIPLKPEEEKLIESLDSPRLSKALAGMKGLWELKMGVKNPEQYTPDNPLYPDRDEDGVALSEEKDAQGKFLPLARPAEADQIARAEFREFGKLLMWKPQTTSEVLRDLIYLYGPYHKVTAVRTTAIILTFQAEFYKRLGIEQQVFKDNATKVVKTLFTHEANWTLAKLKEAPLTEEQRTAKFTAYIEGTRQASLRAMMNLKGSDETRGLEDIDNLVKSGVLKPEEGARLKEELIAFRRERNRLASEMGTEILNTQIVPAMEAVYPLDAATELRGVGPGAIANYPAQGPASWTKFYADLRPIIEELNKIPSKNDDFIKQAILDQRFVKYNLRPGMAIAVAHGIHKTHPLVHVYPVVTAINADYVRDLGAQTPDEGLEELKKEIEEFTSAAI